MTSLEWISFFILKELFGIPDKSLYIKFTIFYNLTAYICHKSFPNGLFSPIYFPFLGWTLMHSLCPQEKYLEKLSDTFQIRDTNRIRHSKCIETTQRSVSIAASEIEPFQASFWKVWNICRMTFKFGIHTENDILNSMRPHRGLYLLPFRR